jgi:hypothetical protein
MFKRLKKLFKKQPRQTEKIKISVSILEEDVITEITYYPDVFNVNKSIDKLNNEWELTIKASKKNFLHSLGIGCETAVAKKETGIGQAVYHAKKNLSNNGFIMPGHREAFARGAVCPKYYPTSIPKKAK